MTLLIQEEKEVLRTAYSREGRSTFTGKLYSHAARLAERGLLIPGRYATFEPITEKMEIVEALLQE